MKQKDYYALGILGAAGIRCDSSVPSDFLEGYLKMQQRYDRKPNCKPPNKPCGQICVPPSSVCGGAEEDSYNKSISQAREKGRKVPLVGKAIGGLAARSQKKKLERDIYNKSPEKAERDEKRRQEYQQFLKEWEEREEKKRQAIERGKQIRRNIETANLLVDVGTKLYEKRQEDKMKAEDDKWKQENPNSYVDPVTGRRTRKIEQVNDSYALGILDAAGIRCDSPVPSDFLEGYLRMQRRYDRRPNCKPPNKPCGQICVPPTSNCSEEDVANQERSIAEARNRGKRIFKNSSLLGRVFQGAGGKIAAGKRRKQLEREANAKSPEELKELQMKRELGEAEAEGAAMGGLYGSMSGNGLPGAFAGARAAKQEKLKEIAERSGAKGAIEGAQSKIQQLQEQRKQEIEKAKQKREAEKAKQKAKSPVKQDSEFSNGFLDMAGIICDSYSPSDFLEGYLRMQQRYDKLNCSPGNKPCGKICIPVSSECDIEGQKKSIRNATLKGALRGAFSGGVAGTYVTGPVGGALAGTLAAGAGALEGRYKKIKQLQKEANQQKQETGENSRKKGGIVGRALQGIGSRMAVGSERKRLEFEAQSDEEFRQSLGLSHGAMEKLKKQNEKMEQKFKEMEEKEKKR